MMTTKEDSVVGMVTSCKQDDDHSMGSIMRFVNDDDDSFYLFSTSSH